MSKPHRVQMRRTKGWRKPANTVYVGRPSKWGNPFRAGDPGVPDKAAAVRKFLCYLAGGSPERRDLGDVRALKGKNLACWCKPGEPCHADVLLELANS